MRQASSKTAWAICLAAVAFPIVTAPLLPLVDWPQHLAQIEILAGFGRDGAVYHRYYHTELSLGTFRIFFYPAALLARVLPTEIAARIILLTYFLGTPLSLGALLKARGASADLALLPMPLLYCWPFFMGFAPFLVTIPFLFWTLTAALRLAERPRPKMIVPVVAGSILVVLGHPILAFVLGCLVGVWVVFGVATRRRRKGSLVLAAASTPAAGLWVWWYLSTVVADQRERLGDVIASNLSSPSFRNPLLEKLKGFPKSVNEGFQGDVDTLILVVALTLMAVALVGGSLNRVAKESKPNPLAVYLTPILLLAHS